MVEEGAGGEGRGVVLAAEEPSPPPCRHMPTGALLGRGRPARELGLNAFRHDLHTADMEQH